MAPVLSLVSNLKKMEGNCELYEAGGECIIDEERRTEDKEAVFRGIHFVHRLWGQKAHDYHVTEYAETELYLALAVYTLRMPICRVGFAEWSLHAS